MRLIHETLIKDFNENCHVTLNEFDPGEIRTHAHSKMNVLPMRYRGIDKAEGEICEDMKNQIFAPLARN